MNHDNSNEFDTLLHNICKLRQHNKLSKKQMADIMGVSLNTLNKIEKGEFPPRLGANSIYNICVYFKMHSSELFKSQSCDK
ncbi:MAG: helix-turn-helix transcriptional regulator [Clostridia bacterium]|nr:helix-turn-helix transcriptional regulator [Clostridia bacterium]